jgi:hypothetical protein
VLGFIEIDIPESELQGSLERHPSSLERHLSREPSSAASPLAPALPSARPPPL